MSHRKTLAFYNRKLKENNAQNIHCRTRGKHPVIFFEISGRKHRLTVSSTPGDYRSLKNAAAQIKRMAKGVVA